MSQQMSTENRGGGTQTAGSKATLENKPAQNDPVIGNGSFSQRLDRLKNWRDELATAISDYQAWVEKQGYSEGSEDLRVYELIESLKSDKLVVALVAEFSRGKTELLNAIFFPDFKQRMLPSAAGRTTMCPTELRYEEKDGACVKLLPIETRKTALTISEYKHTPVHWTTLHILKPGSAEEVKEAFQEVTRTKKVNVREAQELGLYDPDTQDSGAPQPVNGMIDVPVWRHAIINFPHPLLKQGLVILDTPGLNALGSEPELTLNMLPNAHAVLFVLAADIGVSKTDLEVWDNHVKLAKGGKANGRMVVLNKIDAMWDEIYDERAFNESLQKQIDETARALSVDKEMIFPVSAQKGLLGKIRGDEMMVEKSGLSDLEARLAGDIIPAKHEIIRNKAVHEISGRVESSRAVLVSRLNTINQQLVELKKLGGRSLDAIQKMVEHMRREKQKYDKEVQGFQLTRNILSQQAKILLGYLSMESLDDLIAKTRKDMQESWTTRGLKTGMSTFFKGTMQRMEKVGKQADEIKKLVEGIYGRLHTEYGMANINPPKLSLLPYLIGFKRLEEKAEAFRNSPVTVMTEQHYVTKKFFITLVSQARHIFNECNASSRNWFQAIVNPVFVQIREHKALIDRNLEALKKIHENLDNLGERISELEESRKDLENELQTIDTLLRRIHQPIT